MALAISLSFLPVTLYCLVNTILLYDIDKRGFHTGNAVLIKEEPCKKCITIVIGLNMANLDRLVLSSG